MKFTIAQLIFGVVLGLATPLSASAPREPSVSLSTARATRDAEKTLLAVSAWRTTRPSAFHDDAMRVELFNLHSKTQRLLKTMSVLNIREPIYFLDQYRNFANELSELRRAVVLKSDWTPLLDEVVEASADALRALNNEISTYAPPVFEETSVSESRAENVVDQP